MTLHTYGSGLYGSGTYGDPDGTVTVPPVHNLFPTVTVKIRFGVGPYDGDTGSTTLTDVSTKVLAFTTGSGRTNELEATPPGVASVTLDNKGRDFDPWYDAGPHAGQLLPGRQIRITATYAGVTYPVWAGWSEEWPQQYQPPAVADIQVPFVDAVGLLATGTLPESVWADAVLNGNPAAWYRLGETTGTTMQDSSPNNRDGVYRGSDPTANTMKGLIVGSQDPAIHFDPYDEYATAAHAALGPVPNQVRHYEFWWKGDPRPQSIVAGFRLLCAGSGASGFACEILYDSQYGLCVRRTWLPEVAVPLTNLKALRHVYLFARGDGTELRLWINGVDQTAFFANTGRSSADRSVDGVRIGDPIPGFAPGAKSYYILDEVVVTAGTSAAVTPSTASIYARYRTGVAPWVGDTTRARLNHLLGAVNLTALQGPTAMTTTHRIWTLGAATLNTDPVAYAQRVEATEQGHLYTYFDGTNDPSLRLLEREPVETGLPLKATFTDDPAGALHYETITMDPGSAWIRNVITVNYPSADGTSDGSVVRTNDASVTLYGRRELTVDTLLSGAGDARNLAEYLAVRLGTPRRRVTDMTINPAGDPRLWPAALGLKIGDRVQIVRTPQSFGPAITADCRIDGIDHDVSDGVDHWLTTFRLSTNVPATPGWFTWGVTAWGGTDNRWYV